MYLIFEVLSLVSAVFGTACVGQTINKSPLYGHLVPFKEKLLRESFQNDWLIIASPLGCQIVSEHILEHIVICE